MNRDGISKEFFIGRYIYLKDQLENKLPRVYFTMVHGHEAVSFRIWDKEKGNLVRRRVTEKNPKWNKYRELAAKRAKAEDQMKKLMSLWQENHKGSLDMIAQGYVLRPNADNPYNTEFWESLKDCANSFPKDRAVKYNGIVMRSLFETEVAQALDNMGIEYKYDTLIRAGLNEFISPDFSMNLPEFNRCGFTEAMGGLSNLNYLSDNVDKYRKYLNMGLYPNRDIAMVPADMDYRPEPDTIIRMIAVILDSMAKQYVFRKAEIGRPG